MRTERPSARRLLTLLVAASLASACASRGAEPPASAEAQAAGGFVLRESARVPSGVRADFESGVRLLKEGQAESGIARLVAVTEKAPQLVAAHVDLGIAYRESGDLARAEASLKKALELDPRHPVAWNELGIVLRRTGRFAEARTAYEKALASYPQFHFARRNLAILCDLYLADAGCAVEQYRLYSEAVPGDEAAAKWLADLRNRTGG
ncbi:MAG TPA: tetratricopeptide repeat protein [Myxococcota bacterium]|nr:tetratricopeptide repeat protein [Myxococcota bacterium]